MIGWPIAFGLNLPLPLMFGVAMTELAGRWGMSLGILVMLGLGYLFCYCLPDLSRRFVWVSGLMAVTQFLPLLQIIAGIIAISIADQLPLLSIDFSDDDGKTEQIQNELSGFAVTVMVGLILSLGVVTVVLTSSLIKPPARSKNNER